MSERGRTGVVLAWLGQRLRGLAPPRSPEPGSGDPTVAAPEAPRRETPGPASDESPGAGSAEAAPLVAGPAVVVGAARGEGPQLQQFSAFRIGFVGALGVLAAIGLVQAFLQVGQIVTLVFAALFLSLGLDPFVSFLERRGLNRSMSVAVTFIGVCALVAGFFAAIVPVVAEEASRFARVAPFYVRRIEQTEFVRRLNEEYGVDERINAELAARLEDPETYETLFGGVLGAGQAVVTGVFSVITVLVLMLYFLASLKGMTNAAYRLVPRSRRGRVKEIGDEAMRRIGGYVLGQIAIATLNGALAFIVLSILDVPYPVALAFAVGVFGLIPFVGATIGAILAVSIALLGSLQDAIILAVWFIAYQQIENYVIAPRVMSHAVAVPGTVAVVAALIGGSLLGLLGALVAVPLAATIVLIVREVVFPRQEVS